MNGFLSALGKVPELLWSNLAGTTNVRAKKVIVGSNITLTDGADGSVTISASAAGSVATDTIFDAKGDLAVGTGSDTAARLAVGTDTFVLTADSGEATGLIWAAAGGSTATLLQAEVANNTGGTLTKGTVVSSGNGVGGVVDPVSVFAYTDSMYAFQGDILGVLTEDIIDGATGTVTHFGIVTGLDTSLFAPETYLYAGTAGALTDSPSPYYHRIGTVLTQHATLGRIAVSSAENSLQPHNHGGVSSGGTTLAATSVDISSLTADATPDSAADYVMTYDASATTNKKVLLSDLPSGGGGNVATDAIWDTKGDLAVGTGANTAAKLVAGANDTILMAESGETTGLKWVASQTPSTQAFGDSAAEGTADTYARGDHKHAMPAAPTTVATDVIFDTKGDLAVGTGADTAAKLVAGANDTILMADSAATTGLKWVASQTPSTQAFSDSAAQGTADTYARGDHVHGMPASPGGGGAVTQIGQTVVGVGGVATITFSSISGSYTDLHLTLSGRGSAAATVVNVNIKLNSDTGGNYSRQLMYASGSTASASESLAQTTAEVGEISAANAVASYAGLVDLTLPNYAGTTVHKVWTSRSTHRRSAASTDMYAMFYGGHWASTAAITQIDLALSSGNFNQNTVATLWGIT